MEASVAAPTTGQEMDSNEKHALLPPPPPPDNLDHPQAMELGTSQVSEGMEEEVKLE